MAGIQWRNDHKTSGQPVSLKGWPIYQVKQDYHYVRIFIWNQVARYLTVNLFWNEPMSREVWTFQGKSVFRDKKVVAQ